MERCSAFSSCCITHPRRGDLLDSIQIPEFLVTLLKWTTVWPIPNWFCQVDCQLQLWSPKSILYTLPHTQSQDGIRTQEWIYIYIYILGLVHFFHSRIFCEKTRRHKGLIVKRVTPSPVIGSKVCHVVCGACIQRSLVMSMKWSSSRDRPKQFKNSKVVLTKEQKTILCRGIGIQERPWNVTNVLSKRLYYTH